MIRNVTILCTLMLWGGIILLNSCSKEKDNFRSETGNIDPATIEKANYEAYLPLESSTYVITKGRGIDSSHVVTAGSAKFTSGARGYAYHGDSLQSYITMPLKATGFLKDLKEFTLSAWIYIPSGNTHLTNIILIDGGDTAMGTLSLTLDSLNLNGTIFNTTTDSTYKVSAVRNSLNEDAWMHIILSYDQLNSKLAFYTNGKLSNETVCNTDQTSNIPMGSLTLSQSMTKLYIGAWPQLINGAPTSSMAYYSGSIDEIRMWSKCLSNEEISSLYQAESVLAKIQ